MIHRLSVLICGILLLGLSTGRAQTTAAHETEARVPELEKFHTTIYKLWHTAWPNKDVAMLTALLPEVEKGAASVAGAKLPGILRDKETAWNAGIAKLKDRVDAYAAAAKAADSVALLSAAEQLHSQYEVLVRTIRPVLKEVGAFHEVLYMLYHHHVPGFVLDSIVVSTRILKERMIALNAATLPERLKPRQEAFVSSRAALATAVDVFAAAVETKDRTKINGAMQTVHSAYQAMEKVFD